MLMFVGFLMYRSGIYINLGNLFWTNGGNKFWKGYRKTNKNIDKAFDNIWDKLLQFNNSIESGIAKTGTTFKVIAKGLGRMISAVPGKIAESTHKPADPKTDFEQRVITERDQKE
jgi:hypothetical protein